jgi:NADH dehydrogenase
VTSIARPIIGIVGGGFAGLACARALRRADAHVVVIDRRNHHLFQPLLYQVATAVLSPANIAAPIRRILRRQANCTVVMGEAQHIDAARKTVRIDGVERPFDYLVLACGMTNAYFGHDEWEAHAPGLKTLDEALDIRRRILLAFESAELEADPDAKRAALTFVLVGGGPTGVEMAGAIAEIAAKSIPRDFRHVDTRTARVVLIEGADRLLPAMSPASSARALADLTELGVEVLLGRFVTAIDAGGVTAGDRRIDAGCVIWAAGLRAEPVTATLDAPSDKSGRVRVNADLSVPGHPTVFVTGDQMACTDPRTHKAVPGVAQGAMQSGRFVGRLIAAELKGRPPSQRPVFHYRDKGSMATIGRARAVAEIGGLRFGGFPAWLVWSLVHVAFLVTFRGKVFAMLEWAGAYLFWSRGARLITGEGAHVTNRRPAGPRAEPPDPASAHRESGSDRVRPDR